MSRPVRLLAAVTVATALAAAGAPSAHADTQAQRAPGQSQHVASAGDSTWAVPQASRRAAVAKVLAAAPKRGPIRLVTSSVRGGKPAVVTSTVDAAAAPGLIRAAQADTATLAITVDTPVASSDLPAATSAAATPTAITSPAAATTPAATSAVPAASVATWNDPLRPQKWGLTKLRAEAFRAAEHASTVVAVVDSGVQGNHPDLVGRVRTGTDFVTSGGNGWADGYGHGTHVAGIIAASANNGVGVAGLAPDASILPIRVLDNSGAGWASDMSRGVIWAADHGASVINLSVGGPANDVMKSAVDYAIAKGVTVVAAAGNSREQGSPASYPAAYGNVLAVAATDSADRVAAFSNSNSYVNIAAPGVAIASTYPTAKGSYVSMSGTSMATPFVAAAAASLKAAKPSLTAAQVMALLQSTAVDKGTAGRDNDYGAGLVDPMRALCSVTACFSDVNLNTTFGSQILQLAAAGVMPGYGDGTWRPTAIVTRRDMASFMYAIAGRPAFTVPAHSPYTDVATTDPAYRAIAWTRATGISTGWSDGTYRPGLSVNRDTMSAFMYRLAGSPAYTPPATSPFVDMRTTSPFYKEVSWMASVKVTTGWGVAPNATFRPVEAVRRDMMAAFLTRLAAVTDRF